MRTDNVVLVIVCVLGIALTALIIWRYWNLPVPKFVPQETKPQALHEALRTLAVFISAGALNGALVIGFGGRLVMRLAGAIAGDSAQGRKTDAEEIVGRITFGGSLGVLIFVGIFSGLFAGAAFLFLRRWLPSTNWQAGLIVSALMTGTLGVADPIDPNNVDFQILHPVLPILIAILVLAVLFGLGLGATTAMVNRWVSRLGKDWRSWFPHLFMVLPAFVGLQGLVTLLYLGSSTFLNGRVDAMLKNKAALLTGRVLLAIATAFSIAMTGNAFREILAAT